MLVKERRIVFQEGTLLRVTPATVSGAVPLGEDSAKKVLEEVVKK